MSEIEPSASSVSASSTPEALLPVRAVTLFSSGVCYTLREGEVEAGEARVPLTFRTTQINDILKSLVLLDPGGEVRAAAYPSRDPIGRTLQSFAVNVTHNLTRADLLRQLRGAAVTVRTTAGETLSGRIVGVEDHSEFVDVHQVTYEVVSLLGEEGLQSVRLDRLLTLRLLDPRLDREFREALVALASGSDDNRRTLTLHFSGAERRSVRVGYIAESPIWKVSYRLVLPDPAESVAGSQVAAKPYLQGWAMVENTSDDDWNEVRLSLVSGRPVSFIQDLYQPLYVPRPVVPPDIVASPYPQTHGGDMSAREESMPIPPMGAPQPARMRKAVASGFMSFASPASAQPEEPDLMAGSTLSLQEDSAPAQAEGKSVGELFEYVISEPISLPRQQGAMIPIVAGEIEGEKLSLYNAQTDPRFPLNAVRLKNNTDLHLKGGPITVFDGGVYAGDARVEEIPPGDARLLTYAVDLAVECAPSQKPRMVAQTTLAIRRGVLTFSRRMRQQTRYTLKSKAKTARLVLVEHLYLAEWRLIEPSEPTEQTRDRYRFAVSLPSGESRTLTLTFEQTAEQRILLMNGDLNILDHSIIEEETPARFKEILASVVARRREHIALMSDAAEKERARKAIHEEQERIRQNMAALDHTLPLYRRYLDELDRQETQLQELRDEIERLRSEAGRRRDELQAELDDLEME